MYIQTMNHKITTRKEALLQGLVRYYTGRPCQRGHDSQRLVTTGGCCQCNADRSKAFASKAHSLSYSKAVGSFVYPLLPADHAAALAYCQALDMTRGRTPHDPSTNQIIPDVGPSASAIDSAIARHREMLAENHSMRDTAPYLPKP